MTQGYATITVLRNNFDNGWIGFDERSSFDVEASEESDKPVMLTLRRQSSVSFGELVVSFAAPCILYTVSLYLCFLFTLLNDSWLSKV